jgi:hypothetical protein
VEANFSIFCLASADLYNLSTGQLTVTGSTTIARCGHTATRSKNNKVLIAGSTGGRTACSRSILIADEPDGQRAARLSSTTCG